MSKKQKIDKAYTDKVNVQLNFIMLTSEVNTLIQIYTDYHMLMPQFMKDSFDQLLEMHHEAFNTELNYAFPNHPFEIDFKTLAQMPIYPIEKKLFKLLERDYDAGINGGYGEEYKAVAQVARIRELSDVTTAKNSHVFVAAQMLTNMTNTILEDIKANELGEMSRDDYLNLHQDVYLPMFVGIMAKLLPLTEEEFKTKLNEHYNNLTPADGHQVIDEPETGTIN